MRWSCAGVGSSKCSIRCLAPGLTRASSQAEIASSMSRSPMACMATCNPALSAPRSRVASSSRVSSSSPCPSPSAYGEVRAAVRAPIDPSTNTSFNPWIRTSSLPNPRRIPKPARRSSSSLGRYRKTRVLRRPRVSASCKVGSTWGPPISATAVIPKLAASREAAAAASTSVSRSGWAQARSSSAASSHRCPRARSTSSPSGRRHRAKARVLATARCPSTRIATTGWLGSRRSRSSRSR